MGMAIMKLEALVEEAAKALRLPEELWPLTQNISYHPEEGEYQPHRDESLEVYLASKSYEWILRIAGWLQSAYPQGPDLSQGQASASIKSTE